MQESLTQTNEALVVGTIIDGNPATKEIDEIYGGKTSYKAEIAVDPSSKSAKRVYDALNVAFEHGEKHVYGGDSLIEPKTPIYDGDVEALRKPLAKGMLVIRTKSSTMPLLIGENGTEDVDSKNWEPGTKVKALISFTPYKVGTYDGVSASVKFMAVIEKTQSMTLKERASALLAAFGDEE